MPFIPPPSRTRSAWASAGPGGPASVRAQRISTTLPAEGRSGSRAPAARGHPTYQRAPAALCRRMEQEPYDSAVLLVHGIGEQQQGATLAEMGGALVDAAGEWFGPANVEELPLSSDPRDGPRQRRAVPRHAPRRASRCACCSPSRTGPPRCALRAGARSWRGSPPPCRSSFSAPSTPGCGAARAASTPPGACRWPWRSARCGSSRTSSPSSSRWSSLSCCSPSGCWPASARSASACSAPARPPRFRAGRSCSRS